MSRCEDYVNQKTGEQAVGVLVVKGGKYPRGTAFATMFAEGALHIAKAKLTSVQHRVLLALISKMGFANFVRISQKSLAEELSIAPSNMSTAIRALIKIGFIAKQADPEDAGRDLLRVSPHLAWRGKPREWSEAVNRGEGAAFAAVPRRAPKRSSKAHGHLKMDGHQHT